MQTAQSEILSHDSRGEITALLTSRLRVTLWIFLCGLLALSIRDMLGAPGLSVAVYVVRALCALLALGLLASLRVDQLTRHPVALVLVAGVVVCVDVAAVSSLRQDSETTPFLLSAVAVYGATVFPWGVGPQLGLVVAAELAILWDAYAITGSLTGAVSYHSIAAVFAVAMSVYVAHELERQRREIERGARALGRSEAYFRSLIESSSDLITVISSDGTILFDSPAHERLLGYTRDERIGTNALALVHPDDIAHVLEAIAQGIQAPGQVATLEYRYRHKNGSWRHIEAIGRNLLDDPNVEAIVVNSRDITERERTAKALRVAEERHQRQRDALITLTGSEKLNSDDLAAALRQITEVDARTLGIARTSIWRYNHDRTAIQCVDLYELEADRHSSGAVLSAADYPTYFRSLARVDVMAADDAVHDPRTCEFTSTYLRPLGISSMMDASICLGGVVEGVLCHEHVGPPRTWTPDEKNFAVAAVNLVTLALEGWERKQAEHAQSLLTAILDATPDLVAMADARDFHIQYINPAGRRMIGIGADDDVARLTIADAHPEWTNKLLRERIIPAAIRDGVWTGECAFLNQDGHEIPVLMVLLAHKSPSGEVERFSTVSRDITERKCVEAQLLDAKEAAEAANRAKSEFLANMSHEIRTPMNGIIGMTELALQTNLTAEQREYLQMVAASGNALLTVINDVLDFSKIEAGKLELDPVAVDVREALADALRPLAMRAHLKGLEMLYEVHPNVPEVAIVDPYRLRQVLINLVGNATKFTEQGEVLVSVTSERQSATQECLHFSIHDTGVGIAPEKQQVIFQAFAQADSSMTRKYGGSGLGLTISRQLVEMMGGRIWVESAVGQGSTFHFTVHYQCSTPKPQSAPAMLSTLDKLPVLVVDDNATSRRILNQMLIGWRMSPTTVDGGNAALRCLTNARSAGQPFPLVLIDTHMPEMSGFDLAARITQTPELAGATIMMLSSTDLIGEAARCRALGVAAFLTKPIGQAELFDAIFTALAPTPARAQAAVGAERTPGLAVPSPTSRRSLHVLLAEDNLVNQKLVVRLLEKHGHSTVVVNNGREAVEAAAREAFDVVFMDVQMPELDGFEATAAIRAAEQERDAHTPIIAMTAHAMNGDERRCLMAGMDDYLAKPIDPKRLFALLDALPAAVPGAQPSP